MTAAQPICDTPEVGYEELMEEIRYNLANRPRDLQKRIGPSEIGDPCNRAVIAKLMELPEPAEPPNWRAWVGSAMHVGLDDIFARSFMNQLTIPRFLLESRVTVGAIAGWNLTGSCDLFDTLTGCVWDWKTKSKTQHLHHRLHGMGPKYRVQFHCYGLGMANAGRRVTSVGGIFMLRDGELEDTYFLAEPYNPQIAYDALTRANQLHALATMLGAETAMGLYPLCEETFCRTCGNYPIERTPSNTPRPTSIAEAVAAAKPPKRT